MAGCLLEVIKLDCCANPVLAPPDVVDDPNIKSHCSPRSKLARVHVAVLPFSFSNTIVPFAKASKVAEVQSPYFPDVARRQWVSQSNGRGNVD
ncbi:hypothetical protein N7451_012597 [Penicillium sp. IBT 35674x]|nr:hypothetical protein N7451_012597 [Penicillium sp. IBT 35674x]